MSKSERISKKRFGDKVGVACDLGGEHPQKFWIFEKFFQNLLGAPEALHSCELEGGLGQGPRQFDQLAIGSKLHWKFLQGQGIPLDGAPRDGEIGLKSIGGIPEGFRGLLHCSPDHLDVVAER